MAVAQRPAEFLRGGEAATQDAVDIAHGYALKRFGVGYSNTERGLDILENLNWLEVVIQSESICHDLHHTHWRELRCLAGEAGATRVLHLLGPRRKATQTGRSVSRPAPETPC